MLTLNLSPAKVRKRLDICRACKFHKEYPVVGITCGTFVKGGTAEPEVVSVYRKKVKLCGCMMKVKVQLPFAKCPAGKWEAEALTPEEQRKLKGFMETIGSSLTSDQVRTLYGWKKRITGVQEQVAYCHSCVKQMVDEFRQHIKEIEA